MSASTSWRINNGQKSALQAPIATCKRANAVMTIFERESTLAHAFRDAHAAINDADSSPFETQVLLIDIRQWRHTLPLATRLLDSAEAARVARKRFDHDRELLTLAYALHRLWLAQSLRCEPADVPLVRDEHGCPRVAGTGLHTSLSHSGTAIAIALSGIGAIGVDIEPASRANGLLGLSDRICHPNELKALNAMPGHVREAALLRLWVRKEALLKAFGVGLMWEMSEFEAVDDVPINVINNIEYNLQLHDINGNKSWASAVASVSGTSLRWGWLTPVDTVMD
jgi:4'-phosphopantetheinyl transferase